MPVENGIKDLSIDLSPKPKRKNIDVLAEHEMTRTKPSVNLVVVGKQIEKLESKFDLFSYRQVMSITARAP